LKYKSGTEEAVKSHTTSKAFNDCGYEKLTSLGRVINKQKTCELKVYSDAFSAFVFSFAG
jgi:hypothetical protein